MTAPARVRPVPMRGPDPAGPDGVGSLTEVRPLPGRRTACIAAAVRRTIIYRYSPSASRSLACGRTRIDPRKSTCLARETWCARDTESDSRDSRIGNDPSILTNERALRVLGAALRSRRGAASVGA